MDKIIKEFKKNKYRYELGYDSRNKKIYPCIEVYKNKEWLFGGGWNYGTVGRAFTFYASDYLVSTISNYGNVNTIKELFNNLRQYNNIPEEIEREYEDIFLLYKLNNFKEL